MEEDDEWPDSPAPNAPIDENQYKLDEEFRRELFLEGTRYPSNPIIIGSSIIQRTKRGKLMTDRINKLLDMGHSTVVDGSSWHQFTQKFIVDVATDVLSNRIKVSLNQDENSIPSIIERIKAPLTNARAVMPWGELHVIVSGQRGEHPILIQAMANNYRRNKANPGVYDVTVDILGEPKSCEAVKREIEASLGVTELSQIKWWTKEQHGPVTRDMHLPANKTILRPEFYPDLSDPEKYLADYLAAEESILMLAGPPGTGKTTLLRHLIVDNKLTAHVIYDDELMRNDRVFQSFLFDDEGDVLIIEDADTILADRERDGNDMMSRFLNVSDGLIKLPNKKLVFTTNLNDFSRVDQALLRPGRCFGVLHTRALNLSEAQTAARVAGLPIPTEKREYTIAELFNQGKGGKVRSVGFGARH